MTHYEFLRRLEGSFNYADILPSFYEVCPNGELELTTVDGRFEYRVTFYILNKEIHGLKEDGIMSVKVRVLNTDKPFDGEFAVEDLEIVRKLIRPHAITHQKKIREAKKMLDEIHEEIQQKKLNR